MGRRFLKAEVLRCLSAGRCVMLISIQWDETWDKARKKAVEAVNEGLKAGISQMKQGA